MLEVTKETMTAEVLSKSKEKPVLVDFWAVWCGPCQMMMPTLEEVAKEVGDSAIVAKVNVDEAPDLAQEYSIRGIPALKIFRHGEVVQEFVGVTDAQELVAALESHK